MNGKAGVPREKNPLVGCSYCPDSKDQYKTGSEGEVCGVELLSKQMGRERGKTTHTHTHTRTREGGEGVGGRGMGRKEKKGGVKEEVE